MKKLTLVLVAAMAVFFIGLNVQSASAKQIGVAWAGKSGMANRVTSGLELGLKEFAPDMKIEFQKELESTDKLGEVVAKWEKEKDGMVIIRSNGAEWLGKNPPSIPTFIGGCNHPGELGAVKNMKAPEGNITGVTYYLPVDTQFEIYQAIIPNLNSILLVTIKTHPSAVINQEEIKGICDKKGIRYNQVSVNTADEVIDAVKEYQGKVTAIVLGSQSQITDNAAKIVAAAGKTPCLALSNEPVKDGALGGFVGDDTKLGYILAQSVVDVLVKGKAIKDVPVKMDPEPKFFINVKTAERLGLEIPYVILETATIVN